MKPLLVGELNPYGDDPCYALYPEPRGAAGDRLCRMIMGLELKEYIKRFDRANLCTGRWSMIVARKRAQEIKREAEEALREYAARQEYTPEGFVVLEEASTPRIVLLGSKVSQAFEVPYPFAVQYYSGITYVSLPHPSGLNRMWNVPGNVERARVVLRQGGVL